MMRADVFGLVALAEGATLPEYKSEHASGMDLAALLEYPVLIQPRSRAVISTGVRISLPEGYEAQVRPRSSLSAAGIVAVLGTIDQDYRGEIRVILWNMTGESYKVCTGDRVAQIVVAPVSRCHLKLVPEADLGSTERGDGGFGSTGR
jgi:dUTP diphosphatase